MPEPTEGERAAIGSLTGDAGRQLKLRLYTNDSTPAPGTPATQLTSPSQGWAAVRNLTQLALEKATEGGPVTGTSPPVGWTVTEKSVPLEPAKGWAITAPVAGQEVVIAADRFDKPIAPTPDAPTISLAPQLSFVVREQTGGPATVLVSGNAPPRRQNRMRRRAFRGTRRQHLEAIKKHLTSLGLWDGREAANAEKLGIDAVYFNDSPDTDLAVQALVQRVNECLDATR